MIDTYAQKFRSSKLFKQIKVEYPNLFEDYYDFLISKTVFNLVENNNSHRVDFHNAGYFFYSLFFYLEYICENNPASIADVGCGANFVKKYIPNVTGFDKTPEADVYQYFDTDMIYNNYEKYDAALAVNSIHFVPLNQIKQRIINFSEIIKQGGRGFVTLNLSRMLYRTDSSFLKSVQNKYNNDIFSYEDFICEEISDCNFSFVFVDRIISKALQKNINPKKLSKKDYNLFAGKDWPSFEDYVNNNIDSFSKKINLEIKQFELNNQRRLSEEELLHEPFNGNIRIIFEK